MIPARAVVLREDVLESLTEMANVWSVPAFMDTELGCQLTELPIS